MVGSTIMSSKESLGQYEREHNKIYFDKECSTFVSRRKRVKLQRLQDPKQINTDNLNDLRVETSTRRYFGKKERLLKGLLITLKKQREQEY
jgi:hypothetical protein